MLLLVHPIWPEGHGERLLLAAIIRRAAYDIALYRGSSKMQHQRLWVDAHRWMFANRDDDHLTSFESVCGLLDQSPREIRRKTLRLTKQDVRKYDMVDTHGRVH